MSPSDVLPPIYIESRLAAERAKRCAREEKSTKRVQAGASTDLPASDQRFHNEHEMQQQTERLQTRNLTPGMFQHSSHQRPASSGFLGAVYQGFVRASGSAASSRQTSAVTTPVNERSEPLMKMNPATEKEIAEKKRDADICAMPAWYH